jgi:hypothetical protein
MKKKLGRRLGLICIVNLNARDASTLARANVLIKNYTQGSFRNLLTVLHSPIQISRKREVGNATLGSRKNTLNPSIRRQLMGMDVVYKGG